MSVFITSANSECVKILTDGAVYKPDGTVVEIAQKVYHSSKLPVAITGRGAHEKLKTVAIGLLRFDLFDSVDTLLRYLAEMVQKAEERAKTEKVSVVDAFEMVVCAYSETVGPVRFYWCTHGYQGVPSFKLRLIDEPIFVGGPALTAEELKGIGATSTAFEQDDTNFLENFGPDMFDLMRTKKGGNPLRPDLPEIHGIGGHCQLTTISASGVVVETLKVWPDKVGEKIDPFRVEQVRELEEA